MRRARARVSPHHRLCGQVRVRLSDLAFTLSHVTRRSCGLKSRHLSFSAKYTHRHSSEASRVEQHHWVHWISVMSGPRLVRPNQFRLLSRKRWLNTQARYEHVPPPDERFHPRYSRPAGLATPRQVVYGWERKIYLTHRLVSNSWCSTWMSL